ncbi:MAG TPA: hypothetical protein VN924_00735 [Bryobacteraceae bacterium]|nr:hypothetical protein [Bryobacteraceae bacterium]
MTLEERTRPGPDDGFAKPAAEATTPSTLTCTCGTHEGDLVKRIDPQGAVTCYTYHSRQISRLQFNSD